MDRKDLQRETQMWFFGLQGSAEVRPRADSARRPRLEGEARFARLWPWGVGPLAVFGGEIAERAGCTAPPVTLSIVIAAYHFYFHFAKT